MQAQPGQGQRVRLPSSTPPRAVRAAFCLTAQAWSGTIRLDRPKPRKLSAAAMASRRIRVQRRRVSRYHGSRQVSQPIQKLLGVRTFKLDEIGGELRQEIERCLPFLVRIRTSGSHGLKRVDDRARPITADAILQAQERLILRRDTHVDDLAHKLREERVRRVVEPILTGASHRVSHASNCLQAYFELA